MWYLKVNSCNYVCTIKENFLQRFYWMYLCTSYEKKNKLVICMGLILVLVLLGPSFFFLVLLWHLLCDFRDSKSNKIGISLHPEVLPFLNLLSAALNPWVSLQCYQGDPAALPNAAVVTEERQWTWCVQMLSMRQRREEHPVRRPQPYGLKGRTPLELLAFSLGTEAHCPNPALHAT